jgi:oxaloacetate decarboxylase beta subunit
MISGFLESIGIYVLIHPKENEPSASSQPMSDFYKGVGRVIMILVSFLIFWLAIKKGFEPLLLLLIGFGGLFSKYTNS